MEITDFLKYPIRYDDKNGYFMFPDKDGGEQMLLQMRGWGKISHLFDNSYDRYKGENIKNAERFQDRVGNFIADAINEKLEKIKEQK